MATNGVEIDQTVAGSGHIFSATGDVHVVQHIRPAEAADRRNLDILREKVKHFWIDTVLEQSLHQVAAIELGKAIEQDAVEHPWDLVVEHPGQVDQTVSGQESIGNLFDALGRTLLILGAPGSGKTITLLELARDLITIAESDPTQPIPAIFNLSTWSPQQGSLLEWLISEMTAKYSVNRKLATPWLENQWILPLLDGLDEVREKHRTQCLSAINAFTQEVGVAGFAVCCRQAEYDRLPDRLRANGAISLQPLTEVKIERHLLACGPRLTPLRTALRNDAELMSLAHSPLMLSIMCLAHADGAAITQPTARTGPMVDRRRLLLDTFIERMFQRRGKKEKAPYNPEQVINGLSFLSTEMARHSQTDFIAETLQPSWLPSRRCRWLYLLLTHLISGLPAAALLVLILQTHTTSSFGYQVIYGVVAFMSFTVSGILAGALRFELIRGVIAFKQSGSFWSILFNTTVYSLLGWLVLAMVNLLVRSATSPLDALNGFIGMGWICGLFFGLFWGLWGRKRTFTSDIKSFEALHWSGQKAKKGALICTGLTLLLLVGLWTTIDWKAEAAKMTWSHGFKYLWAHLIVLGLFGAIGTLYGGLSTRVKMGYKAVFNQGMHLTLRNVLLIGLIFVSFGLLWGGIRWLTIHVILSEMNTTAISLGEMLIAGLLWGAFLALFAVFWFGGHDLVQHYVLRLLLSRGGKMPLRCGRFLRYGAELIFLQRVGGGYRFIHQMLKDHLTLNQPGASFSVKRPKTQKRSERNVGLRLSLLFIFFVISLIYSTVPELRYRIGDWMGDSEATYALGQYYEQRDRNNALGTALSWYRQAAEAGHTEAQLKMARAYIEGSAVKQDYTEALKWFSLAAEQGIADAQFAMGILYHTGTGTSPDVNEAEKWYRRAADQGHGQSQLKLAWMYSQGGDLPFDSAVALKWFQMAAESGLSEAQFTLGEIYHIHPAMRDNDKAEKWYRLAAAQGNSDANGNLGWLLIETGRWDEAQIFTQNAHESDPQNWYWIINLGNLELLRGKRPEAEDFYRQALPLIETERQLQLGPLNDMDLFIEQDWQPELCREMKQWLLTEWRQGQP